MQKVEHLSRYWIKISGTVITSDKIKSARCHPVSVIKCWCTAEQPCRHRLPWSRRSCQQRCTASGGNCNRIYSIVWYVVVVVVWLTSLCTRAEGGGAAEPLLRTKNGNNAGCNMFKTSLANVPTKCNQLTSVRGKARCCCRFTTWRVNEQNSCSTPLP